MFTRPLALLSTLALIAGLAMMAACGGDDSDAAPPNTPTITQPPTSTPVPGTQPSGIAAVDKAIAAVEAGDIDAFIDLILLAPEDCVARNDGLGGPPLCEPGEAPGTPVDVVPFASCEGYWSREGALSQALRPLFDGQVRLYAVYETGGNERLFDREGAYAVIFEVTGGPNGPQGRDVIMTDEGVVGVNFGCGQSAEQLVEFHQLTDAIVEPDDVRTQ